MLAGVEAGKADPAVVAARIIAGINAGDTVIWPDEASAAAGAVYLTDPVKLEQMLAGSSRCWRAERLPNPAPATETGRAACRWRRGR